jgi:4-hydroxy-tetrahydrodipicolinate synthase
MGKLNQAKKLYYRYLPLINANFIETNTIPVKTSLAIMGLCKPIFRSPLCSLENHNQEKLVNILESYDLLLRRIPVTV